MFPESHWKLKGSASPWRKKLFLVLKCPTDSFMANRSLSRCIVNHWKGRWKERRGFLPWQYHATSDGHDGHLVIIRGKDIVETNGCTDSFSRLPFPAMSDSDPLPGETILLMRHLKSNPPYTVGTLRSGPKETRHSLRCFATAWKDRPRQQISKSELFATLNGVSWVWNTAVFFWELQLSYPIKGGLKCSLSCVRPIQVNLVWRCSPEVMFAGQD